MSNRVKTPSRSLTCHLDNDSATAVCGECGTPLCDDHQYRFTDSLLSRYRGRYQPLIVGIFGLLVIPALLSVFGDVWLDFERQLFNQTAGFRAGIIGAAMVVGTAGLLLTWLQGGTPKLSPRILSRRPPKRTMCEGCYQERGLQRLVLRLFMGLGVVLLVAGLALAFQRENGALLIVAAIGAAIYLLRHDLTLFAFSYYQ